MGTPPKSNIDTKNDGPWKMYLLSNMAILGTWNPEQPFINGCFNWMIPNLYIGNGCFTKHLFINGCLGFQVSILVFKGCKICNLSLE